jgi:hypothetical protein
VPINWLARRSAMPMRSSGLALVGLSMRQLVWILAAVVVANVAAAQTPTRVIELEPQQSTDPANAVPPSLSEYGLRLPWDPEPPNSPFREGSWVGLGYFSGGFGIFADDARLYGLHIGGGYYFMDNVSFNLEAIAFYGDRVVPRAEVEAKESWYLVPPTGANEGPTYGGGFQGLLRCHFLNYGSWSLYADGGTGFSYLTRSIPSDGTNYNFILTAGLGLTKQISECTHLMIGHRWFHLSNGAFFTAQNPGYDAKMIYAGLLVQY